MLRSLAATLLLLASMPSAALAQSPSNSAYTWLMCATIFCFLLCLPGLCLYFGGMVRAKNVLSVFVQCTAIASVVSLLWFLVGYSLAFAEGSDFIGGAQKWFFKNLAGSSIDAAGAVPELLFALFQMAFAIIATCLIVGAVAERIKFSAVLVFSCLWLLCVYLPICHWVWGQGWLDQKGVMDFAGGIVVHLSAGTSALVLAILIGAREGFPKVAMPPHNVAMSLSGAAMLWVGWYGLSGGSALVADQRAITAMLSTHISAASGSLAWMLMEWTQYRKPSALGIVTGMVSGLCAITAGSGFVGPGGALVIGASAGVVCFQATRICKRKLLIDDTLDVFTVHGIGGLWGALLVSIFASPNLGVFSGQGFSSSDTTVVSQLGVQSLAILATVVYSAVITFALVRITGLLTNGIRVSAEEEAQGLDIVLHEESGYRL